MSALRCGVTRELRHLAHNRGDSFLTFAMMPLLAALMWWIFASGQPNQLPVAIIDQDSSASSRAFIRAIDATSGIAPMRATIDLSEAERALKQRAVYAVVVIPSGFEHHLFSNQSATVPVQLNAQYATYASTIRRHLSSAAMTAGAGIALQRQQLQGQFSDLALATVMPIAVQITPLFNEGPNYEVFLGATLIPALFQILAMIVVVSAIGRELRDGTAAAWLAAANGRTGIALVSKLLPYFVVLNSYAALFVWFYHGTAPDSYQGSSWGIWLSLVLLNSCAFAVALLIIALTRNMRMGLSVAGFYSAPAFAYSGQAFPLIAMPDLAQYWASILPLTHWLKLYNQGWLAGAPLSALVLTLSILLAMLVLSSVIGYQLLCRVAFNPNNWGAR